MPYRMIIFRIFHKRNWFVTYEFTTDVQIIGKYELARTLVVIEA